MIVRDIVTINGDHISRSGVILVAFVLIQRRRVEKAWATTAGHATILNPGFLQDSGGDRYPTDFRKKKPGEFALKS